MTEILLFLNQPWVLKTLFAGAVALILIDYLFPVDWPAFIGYLLFAVFVGATVPATPLMSFLAMLLVTLIMLSLHLLVFARFLTNAPRYERADVASRPADPAEPPQETE